MAEKNNNGHLSAPKNPDEIAHAVIREMEQHECAPEQQHLIVRLKRAIEHLNEHSERANIVARCAIDLVEAESPMDVLSATLVEALHLTHAERGYILMWNEEKQKLEDARVTTNGDKIPSEGELQICNTLAKRSFERGEVLI